MKPKAALLSPLQLAFSSLLALLFFTRCAVISAPDGGDKDNTPPRILSCNPPNESVSFTKNKIAIRFDEYIQLANLFSQLLISPPITPAPVIYAQGKTLYIQWDAPLKPNTTYHIQLGNAVQDVNEGNVFTGLQYVFSTGPALDSCTLSGKILSAETTEPLPQSMVLLYPEIYADSFAVRKPDYVARVQKDGSFQFNYLPAGRYAIYGLIDKNQNYRFDQSTEFIAFSDSILSIEKEKKENISLSLFQPEPNESLLVGQRWVHEELLEWVFNRPVKSFEITGLGISPRDVRYFSPTKDSLYYWFTESYDSSGTVRIRLDNSAEDTVSLRPPLRPKKGEKESPDRIFTIDLQHIITNPSPVADTIRASRTPSDSLILFFSAPCMGIGPGKSPVLYSLTGEVLPLSGYIRSDRLSFCSFLPPTDKSIILQFPDSCFMDYRGRPLKARTLFLQPATALRGNIQLVISAKPDAPSAMLLQLLSAEKKVIQTRQLKKTEKQTEVFSDTPEGRYYFRVIDDRNGDGRWTTGSMSPRRQPEAVHFFDYPLELKGGWDMETEITIPWP